MDKYVYLQSEYDTSALQFNEIVYDNPNRYQCRYDTDAYQKFILKQFDLPRVDALDSTYWFSLNETYDIQHYIDTVPGCATMYDTNSADHQDYMQYLTTITDAYADQLAIEYTNAKNAGIDENTAVSQALINANDYIDDNLTTLIP